MKFELIGKIPSKKNSWKIGRHGIYQSKQNEIDGLLLQLKSQVKDCTNLPLKNDCSLYLDIWGDNRQDCDNQLTCICDILQKIGIIKNDRQIKKIEAQKFYDKKNPRVEIEIEEFK